jgi:hypothetical protein
MTGAAFTIATGAELTRRDRCGRCGARAFVLAVFPTADGLEVLFCGHHFREYELKLVAAGAGICDVRDRLYAQVSAAEV